jgi:hypothetical protein
MTTRTWAEIDVNTAQRTGKTMAALVVDGGDQCPQPAKLVTASQVFSDVEEFAALTAAPMDGANPWASNTSPSK